MNLTVLTAIFKRDFVNYFASVTGYVFICVFVVLSSLAAFWPDEFFSNNLANLDQLSKWMPYILLVFIPAITMSTWAEERRRGTDELLLTLPATDSDVVIGKYLAGVAIFTVSLLFSMASIMLIFAYGLGSPDPLLFCCTFLGYWLVGLAMLATGMVASFLTSNLTVGFILGMLFCAPQAFASVVDWVLEYLQAIPWLEGVAETDWFRDLARGVVSSFSAFEGFSDFSRGVASLSGALHFVCIIVLMLYLCMVLIGRRHWAGGDDGESMWWHYALRAIALFFLVGGVNTMLRNYDYARFDMTADRINSLSPKTYELIRELSRKDDLPPIKIDAYFSPQVPSEYAAQKSELLNTLAELSSIGGGKVDVVEHEIENFSDEAARAERTYGIVPRTVQTRVRGARDNAEMFLGVAVSCGLDKVVVPFLDKGIPVEYELVRSISTVADEKRKRIGILKTDVPLIGGFSMQGESPDSQLVTELEKQYEVIEVDPSTPITDTYDVLLAVQPSTLAPDAFGNFVAAVRSGQPTAVFEDPMPAMWGALPGTNEINSPRGPVPASMARMMGAPTAPKGDTQQLWNLLGVKSDGALTIWQDHNPYASQLELPADYVFVDIDTTPNAFGPDSNISSGMRQILLAHPGSIEPSTGSKTQFIPLAVTNDRSGTASTEDYRKVAMRFANYESYEKSYKQVNKAYVLAAEIVGKPPELIELQLDDTIDAEALKAEAEGLQADSDTTSDATEAETEGEDAQLHVVLVADIDCLSSTFFTIRSIGEDREQLPADFRLQNVTFVLNILDTLSGDDRFIDIRKRTRDYRTLTQIEEATADFRAKTLKEQEQFREETVQEQEALQKRAQEEAKKIFNDPTIPNAQKQQRAERMLAREMRKAQVKVTKLQQDLDRTVAQSERDLQSYVRSIQDRYKAAALAVPPLPPLMVAVLVFFRRRSMESQGVSKDRLRYARTTPTPQATPTPQTKTDA